jgi:hypothetical protein
MQRRRLIERPRAVASFEAGCDQRKSGRANHTGSLEISGGPQMSFDGRRDYRIESSRQAVARVNPMKGSFMGLA